MKSNLRNTVGTGFPNFCYEPGKSYGSYAYDSNTNQKYLDLFGMYSSLPLGHSHPVFKSIVANTLLPSYFGAKVTNCAMTTQASQRLVQRLERVAPKDTYGVHFTSTGALAVEAALKAAFHALQLKGEQLAGAISFKNSFHGISAMGAQVTHRTGEPGRRLKCAPSYGWPCVPIDDLEALKVSLEEFPRPVIVEPIQCTSGDIHLGVETLNELRSITQHNDAPLIFDEVQTGFFATGKAWYSDYLDWAPDFTVFGKKSQVSGFFANEQWGVVFDDPKLLSVTFDGDTLDMLRCHLILDFIESNSRSLHTRSRAVRKENFEARVRAVGETFKKELVHPKITDCRALGCLIAIDLADTQSRDELVRTLYNTYKVLCNPTGTRSIRLRPSLVITEDEMNNACASILSALNA